MLRCGNKPWGLVGDPVSWTPFSQILADES